MSEPIHASIVTGKVTRGRRPKVCSDCWRSSGLALDRCDRFHVSTHEARQDRDKCGGQAEHWEARS